MTELRPPLSLSPHPIHLPHSRGNPPTLNDYHFLSDVYSLRHTYLPTNTTYSTASFYVNWKLDMHIRLQLIQRINSNSEMYPS